MADDFFSRLPDHLSVSDIKVHGTALPASSLSPSLHRRKSGAEEYNVFYNGSLPLTFMVHHTTTPSAAASDSISDAAETEQHIVPLFAATDGAKMWLTHITPIGHVTAAGTLKARSGFNGYNHVGAGGIKLLGNSDPVATWADTTTWLNGRTEAEGFQPYDYVHTMADTGTFIGHSLVNNVHDASGWGFNAQFAMEGINHVSSFASGRGNGTNFDRRSRQIGRETSIGVLALILRTAEYWQSACPVRGVKSLYVGGSGPSLMGWSLVSLSLLFT